MGQTLSLEVQIARVGSLEGVTQGYCCKRMHMVKGSGNIEARL